MILNFTTNSHYNGGNLPFLTHAKTKNKNV